MSSVFKSERKCSYDPTKDTELTGYEALAFAIVRQAVEDYKEAVINENERQIRPLLRFFESPWCMMLTELDMPSVARKLDRNIKEFLIRAGLKNASKGSRTGSFFNGFSNEFMI